MHLHLGLSLVIMAVQLKPFRQMDSHLERRRVFLLLVTHDCYCWSLFISLNTDGETRRF